MSNFLAIATVTATLRQMLNSAVQADVSGAEATAVRPDSSGAGLPARGVNIFLYQLSPNAAWTNGDLPTRSSNGQLMQRPQAAFDLHYLLSFYGDEADLEPQRLLGSVVRTLHARPLLTRQAIRNVINAAISADPNHYLARSNLGEQMDLVKFTPLSLSLEELSKLWSVFFQTSYALSVAYQGTVVLIESDAAAEATLPVREPRLHVTPFRRLAIDAVEPQIVEFSLAAAVRLKGEDLRSDDTEVLFGDLAGTLDPSSTSKELVVILPSGIRAGVNSVRVVQRLPLGAPHTSFESNAAFFGLRPRIDSIAFEAGSPADARFVATVSPVVGARQEVVLMLNQFAASLSLPAASPPAASPPAELLAFQLPARPRTQDTDPLVFNAGSVPPAVYLARVRVDGVESTLTLDSTNRYVGPTVTVS